MLFSTLLAAVLAASAPPSTAASPLAHERYSLANGLDVVLHDDDRYPIVEVRVVYHVGQVNDPVGKAGVSHLLEHSMFGGTRHVAEGEHMLRLGRAGAAHVNARTAVVYTAYVAGMPADRLELALYLESDRMGYFRAGAERSTIAAERKIIIQEIAERTLGSSGQLETRALRELLVPPDHPLHAQDAASLARIEVADVVEMAARYYGPANATLVIAGDLPDDTREIVERYFGSLEGGERTRPKVAPLELAASRRKSVRSASAVSPAVIVAWPTAGLYEDGDADADVLCNVLDRRGYALAGDGTRIAAIAAAQVSEVGQSILAIRVDGQPGSSPEALLAELDAILVRLSIDALTAKDVRVAAKRSIVARHRAVGTLAGRADLMITYLTAGKSADWLANDVARYERVTPRSVGDFVRSALVGRPRAELFVVAGRRS
jgi:zinc protease